ncbi:MAG: MarR family transcriptional regulator [Gemmatimonadaceae bacterium]
MSIPDRGARKRGKARPLGDRSKAALSSEARALADRLHSAAIHLLRRLRRQDAASGISGPRLSALSVVVFGGPITLGDLASAEQVRAPTMTRIVQGLERQGLVRRERDVTDRRLVRVEATAKGRTLLLEGRNRRVDTLAHRLEVLSRADLSSLGAGAAVLDEVIRTLD